MTLFTRCIAVLTVLLGLALMAVSAYAARLDGDRARLVSDASSVSSSMANGPLTGYAGDAQAEYDLGAGAATAVRWPVATPTPTATVVLRYPAPDGAGPVISTGSSRDNLSPRVRVWPVTSLKPGRINLEALGRGGLKIPPEQLAVMQQVSQWSGIPWQIFGAIAKVESDFGRNMATSAAGAIGYGQFLPETWATFGGGGDPYDFRDAIPAMGRFLISAGAPDDLTGALYAYNHSWPYVAQVLSYAAAYGYSTAGASGSRGASEQLIWPVVGPISSYFGPSHPLGIDIDQTMAPGTPVLAAHDGVVLFAGGDPCCSYGRYVILVAPSGLSTLYAHFDTLAVVSGQTVRRGEPLGIVGCTGYCTGTHLHFELIVDGVRRDPLDYLP